LSLEKRKRGVRKKSTDHVNSHLTLCHSLLYSSI
jgi:hypothetical protein